MRIFSFAASSGGVIKMCVKLSVEDEALVEGGIQLVLNTECIFLSKFTLRRDMIVVLRNPAAFL